MFFYSCSKLWLLFVASTSKLPFCSFKFSQDKVSTYFPSPHLAKDSVLTMLIVPEECLCSIVVKKNELHVGRRVEVMMLRITGPRGLQTFSLRWSQDLLRIACCHPVFLSQLLGLAFPR